MIQGCVTLDEVLAAAALRAAALVPETSGYLALAVGDATSRLPFALDERAILLTIEGNVGIVKRGAVVPAKLAARRLREVLARLLAVSNGAAIPALVHASRPREESERGVDVVIEEIEAALIPVNRAAARRALARIARETLKAKEAGPAKPRIPARPSALPRPELPAETVTPAAVAALLSPRGPLGPVSPTTEATTPAIPSNGLVTRLTDVPTPSPLTTGALLTDPTPTVIGMGILSVDDGAPAELPAEATLSATPVSATPEGVLVVVAPPSIETPAMPIARATRAWSAGEPVVAVPGPVEALSIGVASPVMASLAELPSQAAMSPPSGSGVLRPPFEIPERALEVETHPARPNLEPITPPFQLDIEPVALDVLVTPCPASFAGTSPRPGAPTGTLTRADELLAHFRTSCVDDAGMREAAACLRRIAGLEPTPSPTPFLAPLDSSLTPPPLSAPCEVLEPMALAVEVPRALPARAFRPRVFPHRVVMLAVLLLGVVGGGALVRLWPELLGAARLAEVPGVGTTPAAQPEDLPVAPAGTLEPQGPGGPARGSNLGARAERGSANERAR